MQMRGIEAPNVEKLRKPLNRKGLANTRCWVMNIFNSGMKNRKSIADRILAIPNNDLERVYTGEIRKLHNELLDSGCNAEQLSASESALVKQLMALIAWEIGSLDAIKGLIVLMLYIKPERLPHEYNLKAIPEWLMFDYLSFMLSPREFFVKKGEAEIYYTYMLKWVGYLHRHIIDNPQSEFWRKVAVTFTHKANFIPLYFNEVNVKSIYRKRADIIEHVLKGNKAVLDYKFPERMRGITTKIRLAILASHLAPVTETFATIPLFKDIDRDKFEVILLIANQGAGSLESYCRSLVDKTIYLERNLGDQVSTIRKEDLDIIIITTNVTVITNQIALIAMHRLARVQATTFNSPVTTGFRHIDYYITGELTDPLPSGQEHYTEKLINIAGPGFCFSYTNEPPSTGVQIDRHTLGIPGSSMVFISCANFYKISPELREAWAKILAAIPDSYLVLMPFGPSWARKYPIQIFWNQISDILSQHRVDPDRVRVLNALRSRIDVKTALKVGDIYLDSFPYSGTTSLVDPLEIGLPAITREGHTLRSRMGAAVLKSLSLGDLVTKSEEEYIQLAIKLAQQPALRQSYRKSVISKMKARPEFLDTRKFAKRLSASLLPLVQ